MMLNLLEVGMRDGKILQIPRQPNMPILLLQVYVHILIPCGLFDPEVHFSLWLEVGSSKMARQRVGSASISRLGVVLERYVEWIF